MKSWLMLISTFQKQAAYLIWFHKKNYNSFCVPVKGGKLAIYENELISLNTTPAFIYFYII